MKTVFFLLFLQVGLFAQNIVPNSSFEIVRDPGNPDNITFESNSGHRSYRNHLQIWTNPTTSTPDLRVIRSENYFKCKKIRPYCNKPRTGIKCAAVITFLSNKLSDTYREYIQIRLGKVLRPGVKTHVEFWVQKDCKAPMITSHLGAYFSQRPIKQKDRENIPVTPQICHRKLINKDTLGWEKISGTFVPDKPLIYLTIGNFYDNDSTQVVQVDTRDIWEQMNPYAYYLIDDVRVWQDGEEMNLPIQKPLPPLTFDNIQFDYNSSNLIAEAEQDLQKLLKLLELRPEAKMAIHGHTDLEGNTAFNQRLSLQRAEAVATYLSERGIDRSRLICKGFGESQPLASENSAEADQQNRRVEFIFINEGQSVDSL